MGDPAPQVRYLCGSTPEYTFCTPNASGDSILAIPEKAPKPDDVRRIQGWFGSRAATPEVLAMAPQGISLPPGTRFYKVTKLLPGIISARIGTRDGGVGPNCYQAAMTAAGYRDVEGRYVHTDEFRYYLKRDYATVACGAAPFGALVVYDDAPQSYDAGDHAAFHLLGAIVFQKGGWQKQYPYEVATRDGAMRAVDSHWVPSREDRFGGGSRPDPNRAYKYLCYRRRPQPLVRKTSSQKADRAWFVPLMQYYSRRLAEAARIPWSEFPGKRIDLLTIENMWRVTRGFSDRVGNYNALDVLLTIDDDVAAGYLKLESLSWQYQAMVTAYDPIREGTKTRQLEELYRKHYVNFDRDFYEELRLYLKLLGAPEKRWPAIEAAVVAKIKAYDPVLFSRSGGTQGIPYLEIVKEAIRTAP